MATLLTIPTVPRLHWGLPKRDGTTRGALRSAEWRSPNDTAVRGSSGAVDAPVDTGDRRQGSLTVSLARGQIIGLEDCNGVELDLQSGQLWITQAGDHRDIIVQTGQRFWLDRGGLALVTATLASQLNIVPVDAKLRSRLRFL